MDKQRLQELAGLPITEGTLSASAGAFRALNAAIDSCVQAVEDDQMVDEDDAKLDVLNHVKDYLENL